jgi:hypothetical protein
MAPTAAKISFTIPSPHDLLLLPSNSAAVHLTRPHGGDLDGEPRSDLIGPPTRLRREGRHVYGLTFAGLVSTYVVSQHAARHPLARFSIREDGTFLLRGPELRGSSLGELLLRD